MTFIVFLNLVLSLLFLDNENLINRLLIKSMYGVTKQRKKLQLCVNNFGFQTNIQISDETILYIRKFNSSESFSQVFQTHLT